jgi:dTDP-4-dehydrorhamnose 3,5-epimerase
MRFREGPIAGVLIRPLQRLRDARGWLVELYRIDELAEEHQPAMAYISQTMPGVVRGPHEHRDQSDVFAFVGPGDFKLYLWDTRPDSATAGHRQVFVAGESQLAQVVVPPGVVHAYQNISPVPGLVFNSPNRLYAGRGRQAPVDEIRHETLPDSPFLLD